MIAGGISGRPGRTRTLDIRFWRPSLYQLNYWPMSDPILAGLPVKGMLVAPRAILLHLKTIRIVRLVLLGGVVATLALSAGESNQCTHNSSYYKATNVTR